MIALLFIVLLRVFLLGENAGEAVFRNFGTLRMSSLPQGALITTTAFVPKDVAIKMNFLLYRISKRQNDMYGRICFILISSEHYVLDIC